MTAQAIVIEILQGVIRITRGGKVPLMARVTIRRRSGIAGGMTTNARQGRVGAGQRKCCLTMIEC